MNTVQYQDLGGMRYQEAWDLQEELAPPFSHFFLAKEKP